MAKGDVPGRRLPLDVEGRPKGPVSRVGGRVAYGGAPAPSAAMGLPEPSAPAQTVVAPPSIQRPPEAKDFNLFGTLTGATTATTTPPAIIAGTTFQVPAGNVGVIRALTLDVNNLLASSNIVWGLRFNETRVEGWDALTQFPRNVAAASLAWGPEETFIPVPEGASIDLVVQVNDGGTYTLGGSYHGWYYSMDLAERFAMAWG